MVGEGRVWEEATRTERRLEGKEELEGYFGLSSQDEA